MTIRFRFDEKIRKKNSKIFIFEFHRCPTLDGFRKFNLSYSPQFLSETSIFYTFWVISGQKFSVFHESHSLRSILNAKFSMFLTFAGRFFHPSCQKVQTLTRSFERISRPGHDPGPDIERPFLLKAGAACPGSLPPRITILWTLSPTPATDSEITFGGVRKFVKFAHICWI